MKTPEEMFKSNLEKRRKTAPITKGDTWQRFCDEFLFEEKGANRTEETIISYQKHMRRVAKWLGEESGADGFSMPIAALDVEGIGSYYHEWLTEQELSQQTIISAMRNFRVFYYWLMKRKLVQQQDIVVKVVEPPIKEVFSAEEIRRLTRKKPELEHMVEYRNWVLVQYLLATGNRIGSVLSLTVGDIDFENNEIRIQFTKNRRPQIMALTPKMKYLLGEWIKAYRSDGGVPIYSAVVFCNQFGEEMPYKTASDSMEDYFKDRKVQWNGFHKFRHSFAANWIRQGGDSLTLKTQLGHSSLAMTNRYANLYGKAVAKEVNKYALINAVKVDNGRKKLKLTIDKKPEQC